MIVYHGSLNQDIIPTYGLGEEKHDYGKGFYLTENIELAKEWAVCTPNDMGGWVHKYQLDLSELAVLDFEKEKIIYYQFSVLFVDEEKNHRLVYSYNDERKIYTSFIC